MIHSEDRYMLRQLGVQVSRTLLSDTREHLGQPVVDYYFNAEEHEVAHRFYGNGFTLSTGYAPRVWSPRFLFSDRYRKEEVTHLLRDPS